MSLFRSLPPLAAASALLLAPAATAATLVVANKAEATVSLVDLASGEVRATLPTGIGPHEVAISPDGALALVTDYGGETPGSTLTLVDVAGARVVRTIDLGEHRRPHGAVWLDDRRVLVTAEASQSLVEVDVVAGRLVRALATGQRVSHMVAATADGLRAFVANIGSGTVTAIDLGRGEKLADVPTGEGAEGIDLARDDREVWVTNRAADTVTVLDALTLERLAELPSAGFPIRSTATSRGSVLVTHARGGHLAVFSVGERAETGRVVFDLEALGGDGRLFGDRFGRSSVPIGVVVSADGRLAYVAHANADVITEVDLDALAVLRTLHAGKEPDGMGWTAVDVAASGATP